MTGPANVLTSACAWAKSAQPKKRSRSLVSRLSDAIRAMKPAARTSTEEKVCVIDGDSLTEIQECHISFSKMPVDSDDISTQSGSSRRQEKVKEEEQLNSESPDRCSRKSSKYLMSELLNNDTIGHLQELSPLPGSTDEISMPFTLPEKSELDELAIVIADRARSKFSGRVYQDVHNVFLAVDDDGDGQITQAEAVAFCQHFDLSSEIALRFFTLLDRHGTGLTSWTSFMAKYAAVFNNKTDFQRNSGIRCERVRTPLRLPIYRKLQKASRSRSLARRSTR
eukprot:gnl/MRDRNA2_/MRDRNA2_97166_c0_seq1.p1 gnl/MRDRNA2_/MRDRNA2_97166_c0~~gnl/MRDRNA2_/MRDRNA2_97166_c0_seq1.p1  ORF type:complete len:297 (-),score=32.83 gnl/MRDRNA2_/MRDRNA2_97166_c0_seq1:163-1005(-)